MQHNLLLEHSKLINNNFRTHPNADTADERRERETTSQRESKSAVIWQRMQNVTLIKNDIKQQHANHFSEEPFPKTKGHKLQHKAVSSSLHISRNVFRQLFHTLNYNQL